MNDGDKRYFSRADRLLEWVGMDENDRAKDPDMVRMWDIYDFIFGVIKKYSRSNVARLVMKKYGTDGKDLGRTVAYQYIKETEEFFAKTHKTDKEFLRNMMVENIQMDIQMARAKGDFRSVDSLYKTLFLWADMGTGGDFDSAKKMEVHQFTVTINHHQIGEGSSEALQFSLDDPKALPAEKRAMVIEAIDNETIPFEEITTTDGD